ncbi:short-subunit dehydrogenase [Pedobacter sp. UYP30]|uniref:SDR family NAD(P)-dependent oxidoreductase n=1 Tax=Pedobacter sp. UYP30 TaxID=1756400 RepID=UPI0033929FEF
MKKTALITGASSGIGEEFAKIHAERGGDLVIVARSIGKLNALKTTLEEKHNISVLVIEKDLSQANAAKEVYEEVIQAKIKIDYLINNAGFGGMGKFYERSVQEDLAMISLNVLALTELTHYFLVDFVKRNEGKILNVSSTASLMAGPGQAVYFATKAYVTSFSNAIAAELHNKKVTVSNLMPGATDSNFGERSGMDNTVMFSKTASARVVAKQGYNGMLRGKLNVLAGLDFTQKIAIGMVKFVPRKIMLLMVRKLQKG